jgi:hypothetical protein
MPADVLERAEFAVVTAHDQYRLVTGSVLVKVPGLRNVIGCTRKLPDARPQQFVLALCKIRRRVTLGWDRDGHRAMVASLRPGCNLTPRDAFG